MPKGTPRCAVRSCATSSVITTPLPLCLPHRLQVILGGTHAALELALQQAPVVRALKAHHVPASAMDAEVFELLHRVHDAFGKDERLATVDLLQRLGRQDVDPVKLAAHLRPLGVRARELWLNGRNRRGYVAADVRAAVKRVPRFLERLERNEDHPYGYIDPTAIPSRPHEPVVYFLRNGDRVKIGYTTNLRTRMVSLALRPADVVLLLDGGQELEAALHERFAVHRCRSTEWFELAPDLLEYINTMRTKADLPELRKAM